MAAALSKNGHRLLRGFFALVVVFLYAPIVVLLVFSFNASELPAFPLGGFTLHWYRQFLGNGELRGSLETSALVAALSSLGAVLLGTLASIPLARRRFVRRVHQARLDVARIAAIHLLQLGIALVHFKEPEVANRARQVRHARPHHRRRPRHHHDAAPRACIPRGAAFVGTRRLARRRPLDAHVPQRAQVGGVAKACISGTALTRNKQM